LDLSALPLEKFVYQGPPVLAVNVGREELREERERRVSWDLQVNRGSKASWGTLDQLELKEKKVKDFMH